jgi:hypothetical protein
MLRSNLPCLTCQAPEAADVRHLLGAGAFSENDAARNTSPSGLPVICCKVKVLGDASIAGREQTRGIAIGRLNSHG